MKCPNCQKENIAGTPNCIYCGESLSFVEPSWLSQMRDKKNDTIFVRQDAEGNILESQDPREQLAQDMGYMKEAEILGKDIQKKYRESARRKVESHNNKLLNEISQFTEYTIPSVETMTNEQRMALVNKNMAELEGNIVMPGNIFSETPDTNKKQENILPLKNFALERAKKSLYIFLSLFVVVIISLSAFFVINIINKRKLEEKEKNKAQVMPSILDDMIAHTIRIPAEDGQTIYVKELHQNFLVTNGYAVLEIPDHMWYEGYDDYLDSTMDVTVTPFIKRTSGNNIPLDPINYTIEIPESPLNIESPTNLYDTVYTSVYRIKINVRKDSKLWINGEEYSDIVNSDDGKIIFNANVRAIGENKFNIKCKAQYCRPTEQVVVINRPKQEVPVDLASDISSESTFDYMTVRASTVPGAYIMVQTPHTDLDITNIDIDGSFSFKAVFDKIGDNEIVFTASEPGKKVTEIKHKVYYVPDIDRYSRVAWAMNDENYSHLINTIGDRVRAAQKYVCLGKVEEFLTESPQLAIMNCGTEDKPLKILIENKTAVVWEIGKSYRVYADAYGLYKDMPRLTGRYCYKQ